MIPEEAVEAAYDALPLDSYVAGFDHVRAMLEAAAPYMTAPLVADLDKWAGKSKSGFYDEAQDDVVQILGPYRSQA